jgi:hypothetical protein
VYSDEWRQGGNKAHSRNMLVVMNASVARYLWHYSIVKQEDNHVE